MKLLWLVVLVAAAFVAVAAERPAAPVSAPAPKAAWTVLVFMNGDNNLEPMALLDFAEMRKAPPSAQVNVVVLFDRIGDYQDEIKDSSVPRWSRTVLFKMTPGTRPRPEDGIDLKLAGFETDELDMGDPQVLKRFVAWGRHRFPAERHALVIWDHGQGWRAGERKPAEEPFRSAKASPMKAVSFDDTSGRHLYNSGIQSALADLGPDGHFDVLGFDACLMAMLESAYAFRGAADWMVGSEDLEPGYGWDYASWLGELVKEPGMDGETLAKAIVRSYQETYAPGSPTADPTVTLSAIRLDRVETAASALDALVRSWKNTPDRETVTSARASTPEFAPGRTFHHVDLIRFLDLYAAGTRNATLRGLATTAGAKARDAVALSLSGPGRADWHPQGLAIYFPRSAAEFEKDPHSEGGYVRGGSAAFPVEFVQTKEWAPWLRGFLAAR